MPPAAGPGQVLFSTAPGARAAESVSFEPRTPRRRRRRGLGAVAGGGAAVSRARPQAAPLWRLNDALFHSYCVCASVRMFLFQGKTMFPECCMHLLHLPAMTTSRYNAQAPLFFSWEDIVHCSLVCAAGRPAFQQAGAPTQQHARTCRHSNAMSMHALLLWRLARTCANNDMLG